MILYTLASNPLFSLHERELKVITFVPKKQKFSVTIQADDVIFFINYQDDINKVTEINRTYDKATSAKFIFQQSTALPIGPCDTGKQIMPIRYKPEATILWIIYPGTINWTTYFTWTTITIKAKIFTRDDYLRDPHLRLHTFSHCPDSGTTQKPVLSHMCTYVRSLLQCYGKNGMRSFPCSHNILKLLASEGGMEMIIFLTRCLKQN
jgi:hypothetical protein